MDLGKKTNQNFTLIPFNLFIELVKYKALMQGINIILVEESYTSKTSFVDKEQLFKFSVNEKENKKLKNYKFIGKRVKRGLFKTKQNKLINADVNGAYNILRKVFGNEIYNIVNPDSIVVSHPSKYCCV